VLFLVAHRTLL